jgi:predicted amidohydrolase
MNSKIEIPLVTTVNRAIVATCNLNNWALDFDGNLFRIIESIKQAKSKG